MLKLTLLNILFIVIFSSTFFISCFDTGQIDPDENRMTYTLKGYYTKPNNGAPSFSVDSIFTDEFVTFDGLPIIELDTINDSTVDVVLVLNNLSIAKDNINYYIDSVRVEELIDSSWVHYVEFNTKYTELTKIASILVLDVSSSLGSDFQNVKDYAKEFIDIILDKVPDATIGIVDFSTDIHSIKLSTNRYEISSYINKLTQGQYTSLYDAMKQGITLLKDPSINAEGKAIVTFTDGRDNYSKEASPSELKKLLLNSNIKSYTMGLDGNGGVEHAILDSLALNGAYRYTDDINDLNDIFKLFAETVSNVYKISYKRNDLVIPNARELKFVFYVSPVKK